MIAIINAPGDAAAAARLKQDLTAAGYTVADPPQPGREHVLVVVLSPQASADPTVMAAVADALDSGQHIASVLAQPVPLPKLIDHLPALDFTESYDADALKSYVAALSAPGVGLPMKVITPKVQRGNRRIGLWLGALAVLWFVLGLVLVGVFGIQAPAEEYNTVETEVAVTIQSALQRSMPRSTEDALNFDATVQAAPTAQRPLLVATATALVENNTP